MDIFVLLATTIIVAACAFLYARMDTQRKIERKIANQELFLINGTVYRAAIILNTSKLQQIPMKTAEPQDMIGKTTG